MIKKLVKGKVYVFIDAANIFYAQKTLGWRISYEHLMRYFKKECKLGKCFVYTAHVPGNKDQDRFLRMLEKTGFLVRTKPVKIIQLNKKQSLWKANFDVELTIDAIDSLKRYKTAILVSGDSDFSALIYYLQKRKRCCIVMSSRDHIARELIKAADKYVYLDKLRGEVALEKNHPRRAGGSSSNG